MINNDSSSLRHLKSTTIAKFPTLSAYFTAAIFLFSLLFLLSGLHDSLNLIARKSCMNEFTLTCLLLLPSPKIPIQIRIVILFVKSSTGDKLKSNIIQWNLIVMQNQSKEPSK